MDFLGLLGLIFLHSYLKLSIGNDLCVVDPEGHRASDSVLDSAEDHASVRDGPAGIPGPVSALPARLFPVFWDFAGHGYPAPAVQNLCFFGVLGEEHPVPSADRDDHPLNLDDYLLNLFGRVGRAQGVRAQDDGHPVHGNPVFHEGHFLQKLWLLLLI